MLLSKKQLAAVQKMNAKTYDTTVNILVSADDTDNDAGGPIAGWIVVDGGPFAVRISKPSPRLPVEALQGGSVQSLDNFKLYGPLHLPVKANRQVVIVTSSVSEYVGLKFNIIGVDLGRSNQIQVICDLKFVQ